MFSQAMDEVKVFFCQFSNPWALGCQGWVVLPQNEKKIQNHCTLLNMAEVASFNMNSK
jgi:hypothetical protein